MSPISKIVNDQQEFFKTGVSKKIDFRLSQLDLLERAIIKHRKEIIRALYLDFKKPPFETYTSEILIVLEEIRFFKKNLKRLAQARPVKGSIINFPSKSKIYPEPYGLVLIISPWNYPFQLAILPLVGAIAAGNCALIKPSKDAPHTSKLLKKLIQEIYPPKFVALFQGDHHLTNELIDQDIDYIFFTGSPRVGKIIMKQAADKLVPVTLELGGKSPCIVDKDADIKLSAKRIVWGKFINCGQTCVAPDYLIVHEDIKDELLYYISLYIDKFYSENPEKSKSYARIINKKHFYRLIKLIDEASLYYGGQVKSKDLFIGPTILHNVTLDHPAMEEEIFGPILPVMTFDHISEVLDIVEANPKPLALYYFGENKKREDYIIHNISFGGGCINDTIMHLASNSMPFGGVGPSGLGNYHGEYSFDTFSHFKSVLNKSTRFDLGFKYPPYFRLINR